jgi:hypothetical protein
MALTICYQIVAIEVSLLITRGVGYLKPQETRASSIRALRVAEIRFGTHLEDRTGVEEDRSRNGQVQQPPEVSPDGLRMIFERV